jgi:hypothetical protein
MSLRDKLARPAAGKGANVARTQYRGELLRIGRFTIQVRGGVLIVRDEWGTCPQFARPKNQRDTIILEPGQIA